MVSSLLLLLLASQIIGYYVLWKIFLYPSFSPFKDIPCPRQPPLHKRFLKEPIGLQFAQWINEVPNDGLIRYYGIFNQERLLPTSPEAFKEIFQIQPYNYGKIPVGVKLLRRIVGDGLVTVGFEEHKRQRKMLQPAFKFANIRELYPLLWTETRKFLEAIQGHALAGGDGRSTTLEFSRWTGLVSLDIITRAAFGSSLNAVKNPNSEVVRALYDIFKGDPGIIKYQALALFFPYWSWRALPVKARYRMDKYVSIVRDAVWPMIESHEKELLQTKERQDIETRIDILARIRESGQHLSKEQLVDQAITILAAGHETTATAIMFTMMLLSQHAEIQHRLRAEVRSKLPSPSEKGVIVDATLLESVDYLLAVCNEALRIHGPAPHARRVVAKLGTSVLGRSLPVGTVVSASPWALNRSKALWGDDALVFRPERWIDEAGKFNSTANTGNAYFVSTFSHGPRSCIGERLAKGELYSVVAGLVGRYEWTYKGSGPHGNDEPVFDLSIVTRVVNGLWLNVEVLQGW